MANILDKINAYKREEIAAAKVEQPLGALEKRARAAPPVRGFTKAIANKIQSGAFAHIILLLILVILREQPHEIYLSEPLIEQLCLGLN